MLWERKSSRVRANGANEELPPPLELECLNVLWRLGPSNVKQVREALLPSRPLAYTTVMTVLDRLVRRGVAERQKQGRSFRYEPSVAREQLQQTAVSQVIDRLFDGSPEALIRFLVVRRDGGSAGSAVSHSQIPFTQDSRSFKEAEPSPTPARPLDAELL
jgi:predicted transcriptional regulator